jgi:AcrR family transcriptional regulator
MTATRRSDATRAAILAAARGRFAADGYERATIRAIAADAAIDPAMVMRYFGSKDKLFAAAADFDLRLPDASAAPPHAAGTALVRHFLDRWESDDTFIALLRAGATNDAARERMHAVFAGQVLPMVAAVAPDRPAERAALLGSQVLGLALARYVLRLPPIAAMPADELVGWLGPVAQAYLTGPAPVSRPGA